jgi:hypothetical protein
MDYNADIFPYYLFLQNGLKLKLTQITNTIEQYRVVTVTNVYVQLSDEKQTNNYFLKEIGMKVSDKEETGLVKTTYGFPITNSLYPQKFLQTYP